MSVINDASEIILNDDGSVYHLHLRPEHLADTVITVGDPDRVRQVSKFFDSVETLNHKREFIAHTGTLSGKRLTVLSTGIGPDNIDIVFNELFILKNYDFKGRSFRQERVPLRIFRIGTSGCIQPDLPPDALLVSRYAIGLDNLMHFYAFSNTPEEKQMLAAFLRACTPPPSVQPYISSAPEPLFSHFTKDFLPGFTLTSPGFYGPQGRKAAAALSNPAFFEKLPQFRFGAERITNFEMETAAMYGLGRLFGFTCISFNVLLANRALGTFSRDPHAAIEKLITSALEGIITAI